MPLCSGYSANFTNISTSTVGKYIDNSGTYFSIEWIGSFLCTESGSWTFNITSDDSSICWLGDSAKKGNYTLLNALINNNGSHVVTKKSNSVNLIKNNYYSIRLQFGQEGGGDSFSFSFIKPSGIEIYNGSGYYYS